MALFNSPVLRNPHVGSACIVKQMNANARGKIVEWVSTDQFKVELVDFGSIETFDESEIRIIDKEFLRQPPFAIECCLKEFEGVQTVASSVIQYFEKTFQEFPQIDILQVVRREGARYIVEVPDWKTRAKGMVQPEDLNRSDWSEANTTFGTHFAKHRSTKRKFPNDSDDEETLWSDSPLGGESAASDESEKQFFF